ncbi:ChbG/HpnK family deacetylase [uncultured Nitratireductor sp.]|uniref:ChbG/HpnK family deacetylase n=1 Tax=uncultured Nitratireductor sp. TaxID=520953 RepID=UPI0025D5A56A|nr:ChbG/HpnK family deacetylase [uncultured Nitratireductor sp.]
MTAKSFLPHLDDVGATAGSVAAWKALRAAGTVTSASAMVPCPYYPMAVEDHRDNPNQDLGVHITLTSEWNRYRWRPLSGRSRGLVDDEGFFHRRPQDVMKNADPNAIEDEIAAQVERALADGLNPSHLDAHMGTAYLPTFIERLWSVASKHKIAVPFFRNPDQLFDAVRVLPADSGRHREYLAEAERRGDPIFDDFIIGFTPEGESAADFFARRVAEAGPGRHWLALHANAPDDTTAFAPHMVWPRTQEHALFSGAASAEIFTGSTLINWHVLLKRERGSACVP